MSERIKDLIVEGIHTHFGIVDIYLFGSRTDISKKGGDIDIALATNMERDEFRQKKVAFKTYLFRKGYDLKIDLLQWNENLSRLMRDEIESNHIRLK